MSSTIDVRALCARLLPGPARGAVRWICTKNPFYVLSAGLFLVGLRVSFGTQALEDVWALMGGLAGYALLLALTAWLLIRFGRVWDDARTVLLLVVLLLLAASVTFDELLVMNPSQGYVCCLLGLLFAMGLSEGLLRGSRLELPVLFRVPYHLILALFFLYPLFLSFYADEPRSEALMWGLFGFSSVAGLLFLTLLPAVRRGARYVRFNGSPWVWPLYPWALFGLLALAVVGRALLLCWSMHVLDLVDYEGLIFGPYFLVPFGLALAVLLLEIGLVSARVVLPFALAAPWGLVLLAQMGHREDAIYHQFLALFAERLGGTPLFVTVLAVAVFYLYAAWRRVAGATDTLTATLILLAVVGPETMTLEAAGSPQLLPLLAACSLQLGLGFWQRQAWRYLLGAGAATALTALLLDAALAGQFGLLALLLGGVRFGDLLGRLLQSAGAVLILGYGLAVMGALAEPVQSLALGPVEIFPLVLAVLLAGYGLGLGNRTSLAAAAVIQVCWVASVGWLGYVWLRQRVAGLDYLVLSLALLGVAMAISLTKCGVLVRGSGERGPALPGEPG